MNRLSDAANSIANSLNQGHSEAAIRQHFLNYGWSNLLIDQAFGLARPRPSSSRQRPLASYLPLVCLISFIIAVSAVIVNSSALLGLLTANSKPALTTTNQEQLKKTTAAVSKSSAPTKATAAASGGSAERPSSLPAAAYQASGSHQAGSCSRDSWSLSPPSYVNLSSLPPGSVHTLTDPVHYYSVYGHTGQQLISQISACSPVVTPSGTFFAYTKYSTDYNFSSSTNAAGQCLVSDARVGVHFAQVFPEWSASPSDEAGLASYWNSYLASLVSFEQGHVNIISQYASKLQAGLNSYPASPCSNFAANVQNYAYGVIDAGIQADQNYDISQGHGPRFDFN